MQRVNIVIGRFQPFTAGHYKCVEAAMNKRGLPTVICMIGVPESRVDIRHPFPSDMLVDAYSDLFSNDNKVADVIPVKNASIVHIADELRKHGYEIASWACGTDRYDDYTRMSNKYHEDAGLTDDFEVIEVPRTDEDISATKVRNCLLNGDRNGFYSMIPQSASASDAKDLYNILKEQIDKVIKHENLSRRVRRLENMLLNSF